MRAWRLACVVWSLGILACSSGGSGGGGGAPDGSAGSGGSGGSGSVLDQVHALCSSTCDQVAQLSCPDMDPTTVQSCNDNCTSRVNGHHAAQCQAELLAYYQCVSKPNNVDCNDTSYTLVDYCIAEETPLNVCVSNKPVCQVASTPPSAGSCYSGQGSCNPVLNDCPADSGCVQGLDGFECVPVDATFPQVCGDCSNNVECSGGLFCLLQPDVPQQCVRYCCTDADCDGTPGSCYEIGDAVFGCLK